MYSPSGSSAKCNTNTSVSNSNSTNQTVSSAASSTPVVINNVGGINSNSTSNSSAISSNEYVDINTASNHHSLIGLNQYMPPVSSQNDGSGNTNTNQQSGELSTSPPSSSYLVSSQRHHVGYQSSSGAYIGYGTSSAPGTATSGSSFTPLPTPSPQQHGSSVSHVPHHYATAASEHPSSAEIYPSRKSESLNLMNLKI